MPPSSAASCKRRVWTSSTPSISAATAASERQRNASSNAHSASIRLGASTSSRRAGSRPSAARPAWVKFGRRAIHTTGPPLAASLAKRASRAAAKPPAAPSCAGPSASTPAISCSAPRGMPPQGRCVSIALMPKPTLPSPEPGRAAKLASRALSSWTVVEAGRRGGDGIFMKCFPRSGLRSVPNISWRWAGIGAIAGAGGGKARMIAGKPVEV